MVYFGNLRERALAKGCDAAMSKNKKKKKQGSAGSIIGIILCLLLLPILIVNVTMIVQGLINPSRVPSVGGYSPLIVLTDSMFPGIQSGDMIIVKATDPQNVREGDVISFFDPDGSGMSVLTHRVVEVLNEGASISFRTKGDANNAEDPTPAPAESLVGVYQMKIPGAGNAAMFLQSTPGLVVCVAVPVTLLIVFELIRRRRYEKAKNQDTAALLAELEALRAKQAEAEKQKSESKD